MDWPSGEGLVMQCTCREQMLLGLPAVASLVSLVNFPREWSGPSLPVAMAAKHSYLKLKMSHFRCLQTSIQQLSLWFWYNQVLVEGGVVLKSGCLGFCHGSATVKTWASCSLFLDFGFLVVKQELYSLSSCSNLLSSVTIQSIPRLYQKVSRWNSEETVLLVC